MAKQDVILDAISTIIKNIDEIKTRLDRDDNRFQNINSRLDVYVNSLESFNKRLGKVEEGDDIPKAVLGAAKVIHDYCDRRGFCKDCPFFNKDPSGDSGCAFTCISPAGWNVEKDK